VDAMLADRAEQGLGETAMTATADDQHVSAIRRATRPPEFLAAKPPQAIHIAEEGLDGERFYRWIRRATGREISPGAFAGVNLRYEAAMLVAVRLSALNAGLMVPGTGAGERNRRDAARSCSRKPWVMTPQGGGSFRCGHPLLAGLSTRIPPRSSAPGREETHPNWARR
jgi:hypothetical protein